MKPGAPVTVTLADGTKVQGQVWSLAEPEGYVWLALNDRRFLAASVTTRKVYDGITVARVELGKVA